MELSGTVSGVWVVSCFRGAVRLLKALAGCKSYFGTLWGVEDREGYLGSGLLSDNFEFFRNRWGIPEVKTPLWSCGPGKLPLQTLCFLSVCGDEMEEKEAVRGKEVAPKTSQGWYVV